MYRIRCPYSSTLFDLYGNRSLQSVPLGNRHHLAVPHCNKSRTSTKCLHYSMDASIIFSCSSYECVIYRELTISSLGSPIQIQRNFCCASSCEHAHTVPIGAEVLFVNKVKLPGFTIKASCLCELAIAIQSLC